MRELFFKATFSQLFTLCQCTKWVFTAFLHSAQGVSLTSNVAELVAYTINVAYNLHLGMRPGHHPSSIGYPASKVEKLGMQCLSRPTVHVTHLSSTLRLTVEMNAHVVYMLSI